MNRLSFLVLEFGRVRLAFPLWVLEAVLAFLLAGALLFRGRVGPALSRLSAVGSASPCIEKARRSSPCEGYGFGSGVRFEEEG